MPLAQLQTLCTCNCARMSPPTASNCHHHRERASLPPSPPTPERTRWRFLGVLFAFLLFLAPVAAQETPPAAKLEKLNKPTLPNAIRIHEKVISGGLPEGDKAFADLAALGVKTIISVDGAKPDVATAKKHGLRYVHLPHGYDGIAEERLKELAKAVKALPGPIYIHCHHGKHRSPAASASACVAAGLIDPASALSILKTAGTNENYRGLYAAAKNAKPLDAQMLAEFQVEFPEIAKVPPFAEAMVALEHTHDHLKSIASANWKSPPEHPDLDPAHEALLLREHFTEMLRGEYAGKQPLAFRDLLKQSEKAASDLEEALKAKAPTESTRAAAKASFDLVAQKCAACHKAYRDTPLSEKNK